MVLEGMTEWRPGWKARAGRTAQCKPMRKAKHLQALEAVVAHFHLRSTTSNTSKKEEKMTRFNTLMIQAEKYAHGHIRPWSGADITTCKALFPWLYDYLAERDVVDVNAALVDYAEYILKDPTPYGDQKWNAEVWGGLSFLGHVLLQTHKTKAVRPYSAVLLQLAASIHALGEVNEGAEHELACAMAFD